MRRSDEARAWDIEPSRAYIQHAVMEANDSDWEEPEQPWNSVPMGRYEGKLRTFTTPRKKFPGAQFIVNQKAEGRSLAKYTTKELSVMPEDEREKILQVYDPSFPSWSDVLLIREVLSENMGEVVSYIPYFKADCNSPSLVGRGNFEENGERIRENLGLVGEGRRLLGEVALIDPSKLSRKEWRYVMDRTQAPFHICETQLVVLLEAVGLKKLGSGYRERKLKWREYVDKLNELCDLATPYAPMAVLVRRWPDLRKWLFRRFPHQWIVDAWRWAKAEIPQYHRLLLFFYVLQIYPARELFQRRESRPLTWMRLKCIGGVWRMLPLVRRYRILPRTVGNMLKNTHLEAFGDFDNQYTVGPTDPIILTGVKGSFMEDIRT